MVVKSGEATAKKNKEIKETTKLMGEKLQVFLEIFQGKQRKWRVMMMISCEVCTEYTGNIFSL